MKDNFKIIAETGENDSGKRADRIIRIVLSGINLSSIYKEIRNGKIRINDKKIKPSSRLNPGDIISVHISLLKFIEDEPDIIITEKKTEAAVIDKKTVEKLSAALQKTIIFENDNIIAVNKKRGLLVHSGDRDSTSLTLEESINAYLDGKISPSLTFKPGPLHRLDRNTSGIVLFGKSIEGARVFSEMLRMSKTEKYYIALFDGSIKDEVRWKDNIYQDKDQKKSRSDNGKNTKEAVTIVKPIVFTDKKTLALVNIPTGRYHQIRKQGEINNHPLTGDKKYNGKADIPYYLLHACRLHLKEESSICGFNSITAPLPDYFLNTAENFFSKNELAAFITFINNF